MVESVARRGLMAPGGSMLILGAEVSYVGIIMVASVSGEVHDTCTGLSEMGY